MVDRSPSLNVLPEFVQSERDKQLAHFDALDSKAGIVLAFSGLLITLAPDVPTAFRVLGDEHDVDEAEQEQGHRHADLQAGVLAEGGGSGHLYDRWYVTADRLEGTIMRLARASVLITAAVAPGRLPLAESAGDQPVERGNRGSPGANRGLMAA
jgi:hypothetical protein